MSMSLSSKQFRQIRENLDGCNKPLFLFDDDQDGLCSFLLLYRHKNAGKGIIVKSTPKIGDLFLRKVEEYGPDKIFVLDIAEVDDAFLNSVKVPIVWVDHHGSINREGKNVKYFNPRVSDAEDNLPTSYLCYQAVKQDLWIATLGSVADWYIPPFIKDFRKEFPSLIEKPYKAPGDIIYDSRLGNLIRIFSFVLKGNTDEVNKCINVLTRIKSPFEILDKESAQGRYIYKRYDQINRNYEMLWRDFSFVAKKCHDKLIVFEYNEERMSFTSDLSNEAVYKYPGKAIIVARQKGDEMKCSVRSSGIILPPIIEKSLSGLDGYGGGHEHACGLNIKKMQFGEFIRRFRKEIE